VSTAVPQVADLRLVDAFRGKRLLVVGDCMLDRYLWGRVERISPEAPVPIVQVERESWSLGGAANVAHNLAALGAEPVLVAIVGEDAAAATLRTELRRRGVRDDALVADAERRTTVKTRIIAHQQQVVRADEEDTDDVVGPPLRRLVEQIERALPAVDAVVVSDYGKGVIQAETLRVAIGGAAARDLTISVDPKENHFPSYRGVTVITPNQYEAGNAFGRRIIDDETLREVGWGLQERFEIACVVITRGAEGMSLFERGGRYTHLPTAAREVFDVTGAGDTVVGVFALALAAGAAFVAAARLANHAAGEVIRHAGTAVATPEDLKAALSGRESA
jgi:D-beta-D-heptose 7-phosphate kinase/D-beta-D-heptose 1-phosphate adenosyltransferase